MKDKKNNNQKPDAPAQPATGTPAITFTTDVEKQPRGQAQAILGYLRAHPTTTYPAIVADLQAEGYSKLLGSWAVEVAGGVPASIQYHLKRFKKAGVITVSGEFPKLMKAKAPELAEAA